MQNSIIFSYDPDKPTVPNLSKFPKGEYIIKPYSPPRNLLQNNLYWALLGWVEQQTGNASEYLHEMMGKEYLAGPRKRVKIGNKVTYQKIVKSTTKLTKKEFSEYYQKCELFFLRYGVPPLPPYNSPEFLSLCEFYS